MELDQASLFKKLKIRSMKSLGLREVYDLEIPQNHNFILENGTVAHNCKSHAISYVVISYTCAYMKHYYPLEWWTSVLKNSDRNEINEKFWSYVGHMIDFPDISLSTSDFYIKGDRIQAPLWLLKGIGDKAQEQLTELGPFKDVRDLCEKVEAWRIRNGKIVQKEAVDKKTGLSETKESLKLATTAINSKVASTLIISGAMDSLYPQGMSIGEKLAAYDETKQQVAEEAASKISGKAVKKKKKVTFEIKNISLLEQFQLKKSILPAIAEDIRGLVRSELPGKYIVHNNVETIHHKPIDCQMGYLDYQIVPGAILEDLTQNIPNEIYCAACGYIKEQRTWRWENKDKSVGKPKTKVATELTIDVEGVTIKAIRWGSDVGLPPPFTEELTGSVVACLLRKRPSKGFTLDDVLVVKQPLSNKKDEDND
jgi:hypothetical protein